MIEPPTATRVSLYVTIVAPIASNLGPVISMFDKGAFKYYVIPSLNTQSCIRRPLCSTFRFENLSISRKKKFFMFSGSKN